MSSSSFLELKQQWLQPNDIFSVLLLLGGDIVNRALAQLSGTSLTPVTFSFGWTGYAISLLLAVVGEVRLMPSTPDGSCFVVHGKSGYARTNVSWVIGRIVRDYEHWMHQSARSKLATMLDARHRNMLTHAKKGTIIPRPEQTGLCIAIYEPSRTLISGQPKNDLIYYFGFLVTVLQLTVSTIPIITAQSYNVLMISLTGTILALVTGGLSQWRVEKWDCRRGSKSTYVLTRGNGSQHAIIILGNGHGLNLEDLAVSGQLRSPPVSRHSRIGLMIICFLWIPLLTTAAGIKTHTWYLLAVGSIGMIHNVLVAGYRRDPSTQGIHLDFREVIGEMETTASLLALERKHPKVGQALLPIFFPGRLTDEEVTAWADVESTAIQAQNKQGQTPATTIGNTAALVFQSWPAHSKTFEK